MKVSDLLSTAELVVNFDLETETQWPVPDLDDDFHKPLISDVRTLFLSGTLDFNTPPFQAEVVCWGFSNSHHIIVGYAGHEQILNHPNARQAVLRFLKGENVEEVSANYPKLQFIPVRAKKGDVWHPSLNKE